MNVQQNYDVMVWADDDDDICLTESYGVPAKDLPALIALFTSFMVSDHVEGWNEEVYGSLRDWNSECVIELRLEGHIL